MRDHRPAPRDPKRSATARALTLQRRRERAAKRAQYASPFAHGFSQAVAR